MKKTLNSESKSTWVDREDFLRKKGLKTQSAQKAQATDTGQSEDKSVNAPESYDDSLYILRGDCL